MAERTVEVAIQARDEATQVLKNIVGVFGSAAKSTEQFKEELYKADGSFKKLADSASSLRQVADSIKLLAKDAGTFKKLSEEVGKLSEKLAESAQDVAKQKAAQEQAASAAAKAAAEYRQLQAALRSLKDEQAGVTARQKQLTDTIAAAAKFDKLSQSAAEYETALSKIGATSDELKNKQKALQQQIEALNTQLDGTKPRSDAAKGLRAQREEIKKELTAINEALKNQGSAEKGLAGVIEKLSKLGDAAKASGVDVRELTRPIEDLQAELAAVARKADTFEGRLAPLNGALVTAKNSATETANGLKKADSALKSSQTSYDGVAKNIAEVSAELTKLRTKLDAAGVDTSDFAAVQNKLQAELEQTQRELIKVEGSANRYASAQERAKASTNNFLESGRTSLSFLQRLRGQVLSLASAYIGLYGFINQTTKALEQGSRLQGSRITLLATNNNDQQAAAAEFQYVSELADRLGQNLLSLTDSYAKLRAAANDSGISLNSTRVVFEALNESATVLQLSGEKVDRIFNAVTQVFSKGKIQAEELTGQLGDSLPAALSLLAKGLGVTNAELIAQIKNGEITSASLIALALQAKRTYEQVLPKALGSSRAEFNRLNNEVIKLRSTFYQSAEEAGLAKAVRELTVELRKPELVEGIKELGKGFVKIIEVLPQLIKYVIGFKEQIAVLLGYFAGRVLASGIAAVAIALRNDFVPAAAAAETSALGLAASLQRIVAAVAAVLLVYQFATWAREQVEWLDVFADRLGAVLIYGLSLALKNMKNMFLAYVSFVQDAYTLTSDVINNRKIFARTRAAGQAYLDDLQQDLDNFVSAWKTAGDDAKAPVLPAPVVAASGSSTDPDAAERERVRIEELDDLQAALEAEQKERDEAAKKQLAAAKKAAEERLRLQAQVRDAILEGEQTLAEQQAELSGDPQRILESNLKKVEEKYRETSEKIAKIQGAEGEAARARLAKLIADEQDVIRAQAQTRGGLVTELQDALLEATGNGVEVELAKLKAEFDRTVAILKTTGQEAGIAVAEKLFNVESAKVRLDKMMTDYDAVMSKYQADTQALADLVEIGDKTQIEAQQEQNRLRAVALAQVQAMIPGMQALADAIGDPAITAKVRQITDSLVELRRTGVERVVKQLEESFASGMTSALDNWIMGVSSAKEAFAQFAADFLRQIAQMIIQQQILNLLQQSSGAGGILGTVAKLAGYHTGGVIGRDSGTPRYVNPAIFAAAQRYHTGGMVGLRANEVPAILQRGEEVLSRADPRNAMNGGASSQPVQVKVVNTIDSGDFVTQGLSTARGQEAVLNVIRANRGAL